MFTSDRPRAAALSLLLTLVGPACATGAALGPTGAPAPEVVPAGLAGLRWGAGRLAPTLNSRLARAFAAGVDELPGVSPRSLFRSRDRQRWWTAEAAAALSDAERAELEPFEATEEVYYTVRWGSPVSYARPLEILAEHGWGEVSGTKILDFGFGYITHLRLLGLLGADAHGVDVDPIHPALYSRPEDQGEVLARTGVRGRVTLHHGRFPADPRVEAEVGGGYGLIISKNVLKYGYVHPRRPTDPKRLLQLGVSDEVFLRALREALLPGGAMLIYNLCPAQAPPDQPYIPYADGESPFTRQQWEQAGFEVIAFDRNDSAAARELAHLLGWDLPSEGEPGMDLERGLFAWYTLVRRR
jgi:hypothetical protein